MILPGAIAALQQSEAAGSDMHSMYRLVRPDRLDRVGRDLREMRA